MAKVGHSLSFTFRLGRQSGQYSKINLEISEVDTSLPLEGQLEEIDKAVDGIWNYIRNRVDREIEDILDDENKKGAE